MLLVWHMFPLLIFSLSLDTFAVSLGLGSMGLPRDKWLRIGMVFALCEGAMPAIGLLAGHALVVRFGAWAVRAAGALLVLAALWMLKEAAEEEEEEAVSRALMGGMALWMTGLSVSMDELAAGFGLGVMKVSLPLALSAIALQAFLVTFIGLQAGSMIRKSLGTRAEAAAALLLLLLGCILIWHG